MLMKNFYLVIALVASGCGSSIESSSQTQSLISEPSSVTYPYAVDRGVVYRDSDSCSPGSIHRLIFADTDCSGWGSAVGKSHSIRIGQTCIDISNQATVQQACLEVRSGLRNRGRAMYDVIYEGNNCDVSTLRRLIKFGSSAREACHGWGVAVDKAGSIKINGECRNVGSETTIQQACLEILSWH